MRHSSAVLLWSVALFVVAVVSILIFWTAGRTLEDPQEPEWMRRQEEQRLVRSYQELPRLFVFMVRCAWAASMISLIWTGALYNHYMVYAPRTADAQSGRIYSSDFKGRIHFLSAKELSDYRLSEFTTFVAWLAAFGLAFGGHMWSKRKSAGRGHSPSDATRSSVDSE